MKIKAIYIIIYLSILSCSNPDKNKNNSNVLKFEQKEKQQKDTIPISSSIKVTENTLNKTLIKNECYCNWIVQDLSHYLDLTFSNNGTRFNLDTLSKWKNNPKRLRILYP